MKKALHSLSVLLCCVVFFLSSAQTFVINTYAGGDFEVEDSLTWTLDEKGVLTISGMGSMGSLHKNAPDVSEDLIKAIVIESGVKGTIGQVSFQGCNNLTRVSIPDTFSTGATCFHCPNLEIINIDPGNTTYHCSGNCLINTKSKTLVLGCINSVIPDDGSVTRIGNEAFYKCLGLKNISIPEGITEIGEYAFAFTGISSLTLPDSVKSIGSDSFWNCENLVEVNFGTGIENIYNFFDCCSIEKLAVKPGNPFYHSSGNCVIETNSKKLVLGCKSSIIPADGSVTSIGYFAFYSSPIESIKIPNTINSIESDAFSVCDKLTEITIPQSVTSMGTDVFSCCTKLSEAYIQGALTSISDRTFQGCTNLVNVTIPDSVTKIGNYAFCDCTSLSSIDGLNNVTTVGSGAFINCTSLLDIADFTNVTSVGDSAFEDCASLTKLPKFGAITRIERGTFDGCVGLTTVIIPDGVKYIGQYAFSGCTELTTVYLPVSLTAVAEDAFNNTNITDVHYAGTKEEKTNNLSISNSSTNYRFNYATWHYNSSVSDNPDNPLPNISEAYIIKGNSADNQKTYKYKTSVTFTANVPEGGSVQWYIDGKKSGTDSELTVKDSKNSYTVTVVVTDKNGKQTMDEEKVTIKNSFFDKLIWFFVHLFNPGAYDIKQ